MYHFYRQHFRTLLDELTAMTEDNLRAYFGNFQPFCSLLQLPLKKDFRLHTLNQQQLLVCKTKKELQILLLFKQSLELWVQFCHSATCFREGVGEGNHR